VLKTIVPRGDWTLPLALGLILLLHVRLPPVRNINFRDTAATSWNLARERHGLPTTGPTLVPGDDVGPTLLMAATIELAYSAEELAASAAIPRIPRLYFLLLVGVNALMMGALYFAARSLWGRWVALGLTVIYTLGSNVRFLGFTGDVYLFPWYAGILMLSAFALFESTARGAALALAATVAGIVLCSLFRSGSTLVGIGFLLAAVRPGWIVEAARARQVRRRAIACGAALVLLCLVRAAWLPPGRVVWHSLHSGLLEFGGHRDADGRIYPYFVPAAEIPAGAEPVARWSDNIAFDLATRTRADVRRFSTEYEAIMRQDVMRVVRRYPAGVARLVARRVWRLLIVNPWQQRDRVSGLIPRWFDTPLRLAWLTVVALGFYKGLGTRALVPIAALTPLAVPPLLVHSGYLMYNFPAHLIFYLLIACSLRVLIGGTAPDAAARPAMVIG
jgi:hypothetical protein